MTMQQRLGPPYPCRNRATAVGAAMGQQVATIETAEVLGHIAFTTRASADQRACCGGIKGQEIAEFGRDARGGCQQLVSGNVERTLMARVVLLPQRLVISGGDLRACGMGRRSQDGKRASGKIEPSHVRYRPRGLSPQRAALNS